jgi:hypothetical protein
MSTTIGYISHLSSCYEPLWRTEKFSSLCLFCKFNKFNGKAVCLRACFPVMAMKCVSTVSELGTY